MSIFRIFVIPACKSCRSCENVYRLPVSFGTDQVIVTVQHSLARHEHSLARLCDNSDSQTYTQNRREKSTQKTTVKCMSVVTALILVIVLIAVITFIPFLKSPPFYLQNHKYVD